VTIEFVSILIVVVLFGLLVIGVPFALGAGAIAVVVVLTHFGPDSLFLISSRTFEMVTDYIMVSIPMFVLMASLLERSGIARDLYSALQYYFGHRRGGVLVATLLIAFVLGATTGIVGGEVVLLGLVALPQMMRLGYSNKLTLGAITAGGGMGTMLPPSIVLILYGITANVSIGDLFMASATPAVMLMSFYILYVVIRCRIDPTLAPPARPEDLGPRPDTGALIRNIGLPLAVTLVVLGSIYLGIASITESAACGVLGILISIAVRGELTGKLVMQALKQTMVTSGIVLWLVFGTNALIGAYNAIGGIAFAQSLFAGISQEPWILLAVVIVVFMILGLFIDWIGILFLTTPIFLPLIRQAGFDPIWFGVIFNLTVQIAYLTPPFAPSAFYLKSVAPKSVSLSDIYKSSWPFIVMQVVALALLIAFPQISLWLPQVMR